ncbi:hypothetical protein ACOME3_001415 [Neoechinorhynchus agilis]
MISTQRLLQLCFTILYVHGDGRGDAFDFSNTESNHHCLPIPRANLTVCSAVTYHETRMPNHLGHEDIAEVIKEQYSWSPLVDLNCHPWTRAFLCLVLAPICVQAEPDIHVMPCRKLCVNIKSILDLRFAFLLSKSSINIDQLCVGPKMVGTIIHETSPKLKSCLLQCNDQYTRDRLKNLYCRTALSIGRFKLNDYKTQTSKKGRHELLISVDRNKRRFYKKGANIIGDYVITQCSCMLKRIQRHPNVLLALKSYPSAPQKPAQIIAAVSLTKSLVSSLEKITCIRS